MKLNEFVIGEHFYSKTSLWRCTDIGTRTITAIAIDENADKSWFFGPPYALEETVFDENDIKGCSDRPFEELCTPPVYAPDLIV